MRIGMYLYAGFCVLALLGVGVSGQTRPAPATQPAYTNIPDGVAMPSAAGVGVGAWRQGDYLIATGKGPDAGVLGQAKGRRIQRDLAEQDVKRRILTASVQPQQIALPLDFYTLDGELTGLVYCAQYQLPNQEELYLVGLIRADSVKVRATLRGDEVARAAEQAFAKADYETAASYWQVLIKAGLGDARITASYQAARNHLALTESKGPDRQRLLLALGDFYLQRKAYESAYKWLYPAYSEYDDCSRELLEKLQQVCVQTQRAKSAKAFAQQILSRWPPVKNATFTDALYQRALGANPQLMQTPGVATFESQGDTYLLAVGMVAVDGNDAEAKLEQIKVAKIKAHKEVAEWTKGAQITVRETVEKERTVTRNETGKTQDKVQVKITAELLEQVKSALPYLAQVGTWQSEDGTARFVMVGRKLTSVTAPRPE